MDYMDYYDYTFAERHIAYCRDEYDLQRRKVSLTDFISTIVMDKVEHYSNPRSILTKTYLKSPSYCSIFGYQKNLNTDNLPQSNNYKYLLVTLLRRDLVTEINMSWYIQIPRIYENLSINEEYLIKLINSYIEELIIHRKKIFRTLKLEVTGLKKWLSKRDRLWNSRMTAVWMGDTDASPDKKGFMYSLPIDVVNMIVGYI